MLSRRNFLKGLAATTLLPGGLLSATSNIVETSKITLPFSKKAPKFRKYKIAYLSDLHLGPFLPEEWLEESFAIIKQAQPDLLLLGGDYLNIPDSTVARLYPHRNDLFNGLSDTQIARRVFQIIIEKIKTLSIPDGVVAIFGNHDRWVAPEECQKAFVKNGCTFLVNEQTAIWRGQEKILIYGVDDFWTGIPQYKNIPDRPGQIKILLSHNPDYVSELKKYDKLNFDLSLCGHTHGGQLILPVIGGLFYNVSDTSLAVGMHNLIEKLVYTSRGIGVVGPPYRLNCPPEVTIFEIV